MFNRIYVKIVILILLGVSITSCITGAESRIQTQSIEPSQLEKPATVPPEITVLATGIVTPQPTANSLPEVVLPDLGEAPDITNEVWLNTDQPLPLEAVRGKVVLVEFWTFG
jgi:hypothetical protein